MTDAQALARFEALAAEILEREVDRLTVLMEDQGATPEETAREVEIYRAEFQRKHAENRAEAARFISDPDAPTGRLQ